MNAEIRAIKTAAEQGLAQAYAAARSSLPGGGAVASLREDAFKRFDASGLPHRRIEEWKYTDLRALMREAKPLAGPAAPDWTAAGAGLSSMLSGVNAALVTIVNGRYAPEWSDKGQSDPGVTLRDTVEDLRARGIVWPRDDAPRASP